MNELKKKKGITAIALALGLCAFINLSVCADPLVQFPTGDAAWRVDITPLGDSDSSPTSNVSGQKSDPNAPPQRIDVSQFNNVRRIFATWANGKTNDRWMLPAFPVIFKQLSDGSICPSSSGDYDVQQDNLKMPCETSAFGWMTAADRQEKDPVSMQGKLCFHYKGEIIVNQPEPEGPKWIPVHHKREAWIDSKTQQPVELDTDVSRYVFTFLPPPTAPLEMPDNVKKAVDYYKRLLGIR